MAFDTICLACVVRELSALLQHGKIDKVQQPERDEILLSVRNRQGTHRILISANSSSPRVQATTAPKEQPKVPPMFCMLLRKHLLSGRLLSVTQLAEDRIVKFEIDSADEMGDASKKYLIAELMGRYSNIILCENDGHIIDCLKRVDAEMSPERQILPGLYYRLPAMREKLSLSDCDEALIREKIASAEEIQAVDKFLLDHFAWLSPLVCREVVYRTMGTVSAHFAELSPADRYTLGSEIIRIMQDIREGRTEPTMILEKKRDVGGIEILKACDFSYLPIRQYEGIRERKRYRTFSELLDEFYTARDAAERMRQRSQAILKTVTNARDKLKRKLASQRQELTTAEDREKYKRSGDLIMSNIYQLQKGMTDVELIDYYDENCPTVKVKLDPRYTPQQNAQRFYKQYNRAKNAEQMLTEMIAAGEQEIVYLESVLDELSRAQTTAELAEIKQEIAQNGYASQKWADSMPKKGKNKEEKLLPPYEYVSSSGFTIYAGRNNRQNELLTLKTARNNDIWFHTQKAHGTHVVIDCHGEMPDNQTLTEAAIIAAYHSSAKGSENVAVDYTQIRNVKKQPGGKVGMVIYVNYKTAYVTPDEALVDRLKKR